MGKRKLIEMEDFVLEQSNYLVNKEYSDLKEQVEAVAVSHKLITKYAFFRNQKLELSMFVPCNEQGNVIKKPLKMYSSGVTFSTRKLTKQGHIYKKAQDKVFFEGFTITETNYQRFLVYESRMLCNLKEISELDVKTLNKIDIYPELTHAALKLLHLNY